MNVVEQVLADLERMINHGALAAKAAGKIAFDEVPDFIIEVPKEKSHGDFSTNIAMLLARQAKMNPRAIGEILLAEFDISQGPVAEVAMAGAGFLNFHLKADWVYPVLEIVEAEDGAFGASDAGAGQKVQIEFVSANPTGLLHMGNARGGALGDVLCNVLNMAGYQADKEYYINDAGNQIVNLGKSLEARYFQALGDVDYPFPEDGYHGEDIKTTAQAIIAEVGEAYTQLSATERQEKMVAVALKEKIAGIQAGLEKFGVTYDNWYSESTLHESGAIGAVIEALREKGYVYEKDGAQWLRSTDFGDEKDEVLVRANGIPTYFAADIAYHQDKFARGYTHLINIWGADHHGHVARMKGAMEALGYDPDQLTIILMQLVRLYKNGELVKMSKRTGQFVTLEELIDEVGKDAARYFFAMRNPDSQMDFDMDLAISKSNDNPVYYVQYAHARICSILSVTGEAVPKVADVDVHLLNQEAELALLRKIADLPGEVAAAAADLAPYRLAYYAGDLAGLFHSFYNSCKVINEDKALQNARLVLVNATRITLRNVLTLLGVSAPERM